MGTIIVVSLACLSIQEKKLARNCPLKPPFPGHSFAADKKLFPVSHGV
jgi:hypothetical protein